MRFLKGFLKVSLSACILLMGVLPNVSHARRDMIEVAERPNVSRERTTQIVKMSRESSDVWMAMETGGDQDLAVVYRPASSEEIEAASTSRKFHHFVISAEGALTFQSNNDIAVPGGSGTRFDLSDVAGGPVPSFRVYLWWMINQKHSLRLLYAPLTVRAAFESPEEILFDQVSFLSGDSIDALYKFNSYRLSYIYHFDPVGKFTFRLGFTGKIRDAAIELRAPDGNGGEKLGRTTDVGFVPLLNVGVRYQITEQIYADFDADGSWAPQGRAIDAALKAGYQLNDHFAVELGYRTVEGGADVAQVYNFAWFNSVFFGVSGRF